MTTRIFFFNASGYFLKLYDTDVNFFGDLPPREYLTLVLNYSSTFRKQYNLSQVGASNTIPFFLDINGELILVGTGFVILEIGSVTPGISNLLTINPLSVPPIL